MALPWAFFIGKILRSASDRDDDILKPTGVKFALPIPLLWQHNHNQPIGEVISASITDKGIEIVAKIAKIADDGKLKERIDEAWQFDGARRQSGG